MNLPVALLIILSLVFGQSAWAERSELADSQGELSPAGRQLLAGYAAPSVRVADGVARNRQCAAAWRQLRRSHVSEHAMGVSVSALIAKGQRMGISPEHMKKTLSAFLANQSHLPNQRYVAIVDFNKRSDKKRLFVVDLQTGKITAHAVSAGLGSDPDGDGYATRFQSHHHSQGATYATSLGCYVMAGNFNGKHGGSLLMHGIESRNSDSCNRTVEMHQASYVGGVPGRSNGCFAVRPSEKRSIISRIDGGGLLCAYKDGKVQEAPLMVKRTHHTIKRSYRKPKHTYHLRKRHTR